MDFSSAPGFHCVFAPPAASFIDCTSVFKDTFEDSSLAPQRDGKARAEQEIP